MDDEMMDEDDMDGDDMEGDDMEGDETFEEEEDDSWSDWWALRALVSQFIKHVLILY